MSTASLARRLSAPVGLDIGEPRKTIYVVPSELPAPLAIPAPSEPAAPQVPEPEPVDPIEAPA